MPTKQKAFQIIEEEKHLQQLLWTSRQKKPGEKKKVVKTQTEERQIIEEAPESQTLHKIQGKREE